MNNIFSWVKNLFTTSVRENEVTIIEEVKSENHLKFEESLNKTRESDVIISLITTKPQSGENPVSVDYKFKIHKNKFKADEQDKTIE